MCETPSPIDRGCPARARRLAAMAGLRPRPLGPGSRGAGAARPGPESFAKPPTTPLELWDATDYLVRTGQAAQTVPFLKKFLAANPDDDDPAEIRDKYGAGSILRLQDDPGDPRLGRAPGRKAQRGHSPPCHEPRAAGPRHRRC